MKTIRLLPHTGSFAENKDVARAIRVEKLEPLLRHGQGVTLDFEGVDSATQSFVHALISELIRTYGSEVLERILFKHCTATVKKIIEIVVDYMQQTD